MQEVKGSRREANKGTRQTPRHGQEMALQEAQERRQ
jgi:hypothetical protein